ncbi:hypothetical protein GCM10011391_34450 [Pullulanibacillus camelliae]|uniref:Ger(X)C family spore germination protein n=1 Tax=Pullulanibacillus camelliae TaxID=1707096 RepID=A0A8J3E117_9BACL|nr:Ger(x)C family spore germination protein [Pullulanibacillus camelliae]GGE52709.1 hypothetical protein GCM10011391_34450 [Pullulanibacillus camelliae]
MQKYIRWFTSFCLLGLLAGCWDQTEIDQLAIISAVGIDLTADNKIKLSAEIAVPKNASAGQESSAGGQSGGSQKMVRSAIGEDFNDALNHLQSVVPRRLFWGQVNILVIGDKLAKAGMLNQLSFFSGQKEARLTLYPFITKGDAVDILVKTFPLETDLSDLMSNQSKIQFKRRITFNKMLQNFNSVSEAMSLPWVLYDKKNGVPYIGGRAIFKNGKFIGAANMRETEGIAWVRNEIKHKVTSVKVDHGKGAGLNLTYSKTTLRPKIAGDQWEMHIDVQGEEDIIESSLGKEIMEPKTIDRIQKKAVMQIKSNIDEVMKKAQNQWSADIFGFDEVYYRKYPNLWETHKKNWNTIFPHIKVFINVDLKVYQRGLELTAN